MSTKTAPLESTPLSQARAATPNERLHALDNLRAAAMFLGIVLHGAVSFTTFPIPWPVKDVSGGQGFDALLGFIHGFRMQVFFLLAGFFAHLLWQRLGARAFLAQRAVRIGVPLLFGLLVIIPITIAISIWADTRTHSGFMAAAPRNPRLLDFPALHLWFLQVLLVLYLGATVLARMGRSPRLAAMAPTVDTAFDWLMRCPYKPLLLAIPTAALLWFSPRLPDIDEAGMRLVPRLQAFAYYALFFAVGWWMNRRVQLVGTFNRWLLPYFVGALVAWFAMGIGLRLSMLPTQHAAAIKFAVITSAALYAWFMTFAVTGLFLRIASAHRPWVRYMAAASYWWYLLHLPIVIALQGWLGLWPVNGWLKLALILSITSAILAVSYHAMVRYTWIGRVLNGPRERQSSTRILPSRT